MSDFQALIGSLAQRAQADAAETSTGAEHPHDQVLLEYHAGLLEPATAERLRDHLVGCTACTTRLLDVTPLAVPEPPPPDGVADLEVAAGWRRLQSRIEGERRRPRRLWSRPLQAPAAAIFLLLPLGLAIDDLRLRSEIRHEILAAAEAQKNPTLVTLDLVRGSKAVQLVGGSLNLEIELEDRLISNPPPEGYELVLQGEGGSETRVSGLIVQGTDLIVSLRRDQVPPGRYKVLIVGANGEVVQESSLQIIPPDPGALPGGQ